ncbi:hypothetical protein HAX54_034122 [Datura stramonium]|uniref:Proline-tRNA ligase class II C-terminal domain-containing protein n=1 Tax=Datura stramonium TaxID=4076 RepID=A0ABS8VER7_DATST|nr:hypothetical protein [Datura stramonium]
MQLGKRDSVFSKHVDERPRPAGSYHTTDAREERMCNLRDLVGLGQMNRQKGFGPDMAARVIFNDIKGPKQTDLFNTKSLEYLEPSYQQNQSHTSQLASTITAWDKAVLNITEVVNREINMQMATEKEVQVWNTEAEQGGDAVMKEAGIHDAITTLANWEVEEATPLVTQNQQEHSNIVDVYSYNELKEAIAQGKWARGPWSAGDEEELKVKEETGATIRCFPFEQPEGPKKCLMTGNSADEVAIFAKSY